MRSSRTNRLAWFAAGLMAAGLSFPVVSSAQGTGPITSPLTGLNANDQARVVAEEQLKENGGDPREYAAYKAFHDVSLQQIDKKIQLGETFINKYPNSLWVELAYQELAQTYYSKQDLNDFYKYANKGLAQFPDDVTLLALNGWVIPRAFTPTDPDAEKRLDAAESSEKHALIVLGSMQKPTGMTDQQFTEFKTGETAVAHSGLGLVYFRREQYDESAKELQLAIPGEAKPDQTDIFILGADLENLSQYKDAADAFNRCAQMAGSMQDRCKQLATDAMKRAGDAK
jgi:tetratricopeptide (TPR) repeat protein